MLPCRLILVSSRCGQATHGLLSSTSVRSDVQLAISFHGRPAAVSWFPDSRNTRKLSSVATSLSGSAARRLPLSSSARMAWPTCQAASGTVSKPSFSSETTPVFAHPSARACSRPAGIHSCIA